MKRSLRTSLVVTAVAVIVVILVLFQVPIPRRVLRQQQSLAKTNGTTQATALATQPVPTPTVVPTAMPTPIPSPTPTPVPTATPTPLSTPTPSPTASLAVASAATPAASPSVAASPTPVNPVMVQESNGIGMGCAPGSIDQYLTCKAQEPGGFSMIFYLYLPRGFNPSKEYPLVLLMEGAGERAVPTKTPQENRDTLLNDPYAQIWGPGFPQPDSVDVQQHWPSFIVIPQLDTPNRFVDAPSNQVSYSMAAQPSDSLRLTKEIVDTLQLVYPEINANRLYLTGLSMGGQGVWEAAERWPNYWAAVAPISANGDPAYAYRLINLPLWAFQSSDDPIVPIAATRDMIQAIKNAGGNPLYTEYTDLGHGAWVAPYTIMGQPSPTPNFFSWLFAQHR